MKKTFEIKITTKYPVSGQFPGYVEVSAKNKTEALKAVRWTHRDEIESERKSNSLRFSAKELV